jgi:hypothetical protein
MVETRRVGGVFFLNQALQGFESYSFAAPDPTFAFVEGPCCLTLDFVIAS